MQNVTVRHWLRGVWKTVTGRKPHRSRAQRHSWAVPRLESLENRIVPTAPFVQSINRAGVTAANTNANSVEFAVNFNEPVVGVDPTDFQVVMQNGSGPHLASTLTQVSGSGASYIVTVSGITGNGTLGLNLIDNNTIHDASGNTLVPYGISEVQDVTVTGTPGVTTFTLSFNSFTTANIVGGATAAQVQTALASLASIGPGNESVSKNGNVYTVTFGGTLRALDLPQMSAAITAGPGTASVNTVTNGATSAASFANPVSYGTVNSPFAVATGDINGDGKLDLVTADGPSNSLSILLGNGDGSFQTATTINPAGISDPTALSLADLGNGHLDIVAANSANNTISVLLGNGNGTFGAPTNYTVGNSPRSVAVRDVNGDGKPDLVIANYGDNTVTVLLGDGAGAFQNVTLGGAITGATFASPIVITTTSTLGLISGSSVTVAGVIGNTNANGTFTVMVLSPTTFSLNGSTGNAPYGGGGTWTSTPLPSATGTTPDNVTVADVNGDGNPDLVVSNGGSSSNTVSVLLGNGNGTFQAQATFAVGTNPDGVTVADINGDGKPDLLVANKVSNTISLLLGDGMGGFTFLNSINTGQQPNGEALVDINGDGRPDLVTPSFNSPGISTFLGNGDGTFQSATTFPETHQDIAIAVVDVNGDGKPDLIATDNDNHSVSILVNTIRGDFITGQQFTIDQTPPTLLSINRLTPSATTTNASSVTFAVTFSEPVTGVDASDFTLNRPGGASNTTAATLEQGTGNGTVFDITVSGITGDGMLGLNLVDNGKIHDLAGNRLVAPSAAASFAPGVTYTSGSNPAFVAVGDINNDGKPDLVLALPNSNSYGVQLGNGDGTFQTETDTAYAGANGPNALALADLNGDHNLDLVISNSANNFVSVLQGDGAGHFSLFANYTVGNHPNRLAIADVNGDGNLDLIVPNENDGTISVLLGNGAGGFGAQTTFTVGSHPYAVVVADVNGDGAPDILVANYGSTLGSPGSPGTVSVLLGNAPGRIETIASSPTGATESVNTVTITTTAPHGFTAGQTVTIAGVGVAGYNGSFVVASVPTATSFTYTDPTAGLGASGGGTAQVAVPLFQPQVTFAVDNSPRSVAVEDVNGDGKPDLVTANLYSDDVSVLLGTGNAALFSSQTTFATVSHPSSVSVADANGDGKLDLITPSYFSGGVGVLLGNGNGTFQSATTFAEPFQINDLVVADLNNDGRLDLVAADFTNNTVSVLLGNAPVSFTGQTYTFDHTGPVVQSINRTTPTGPSTSSTSVSYTVTFSEPVMGVVPADFALALGGSVTATSTVGIVGGPAVYTVTVSGIAGAGTLGLDLVDNGSITDLVGNSLAASAASFASQSNYTVGTAPYDIVAEDLRSNGTQDLVVINAGTDTVGVLLGNGNGTFQAQQTYAVGIDPVGLTVADVNGDGIPDIIVANYTSGSPGSVSVLLGNGNGTFQAQQTFATGHGPDSVVAADLNGDGKTDIIVANFADNTLGVLLGNGDGTFQPQQTITVGMAPSAVTVADVNADGIPDLVVANENDDDVGVLLGNGNGTFVPQVTYSSGSSFTNAVAVADVNGDGKPDLLLSNAGTHSEGVLLGNGDGSFQSQTTFAVAAGAVPYSITAADVNGDGKLDLVYANAGGTDVGVLLGNGDGTFQSANTFAVGHGAHAVAVGDFNNDGRLDLASANNIDNNVSVLLNAGNGDFTDATQDYTIAATTHFSVSAVASTTAGVPFSVTVSALTGAGQVDTGYMGTVQFSTTDGGTGKVLPANYMFTPADNGVHTFTNGVTLVTATSTAVSNIALTSGGSGYTVGDVVSLLGGGGSGATAMVLTVGGGGAMTSLQVTAGGSGYVAAGAVSFAGGTGSGATGTVSVGFQNVTATDTNATVMSGTTTNGTNSVSGLSSTSALGMGMTVTGIGIPAGTTIASIFNGSTITLSQSATASMTGNLTFSEAGTSSNITVTPAASIKVAFTTQPTTTVAGINIAPAVQVSSEDAFNNIVTTDMSTVTVGLLTNPGLGTLSGSLMVAMVNGVATFNNLSIDKVGTGYSLTANSNGPGSGTGNSGTFNITAAAASHLAFVQQPTNAVAGNVISPALTVDVLDQFNNLVTTDTSNVTVSFGTNAGLGTLSGTLTMAAVNGVATFNNLSIDKSGMGYTLNANDSGGGVGGDTSNLFNITAAGATHFAVSGAPPAATAGSPFSITVTALDAFNNTDTNFTGTVQLSTNDPGTNTAPTLPASYTFTSGAGQDNGVHTFTGGVTLDTAGATRTVTATSLPISTFVSSSQGLNGPVFEAFDSSGNLYVADYGNNTIFKVTPAGSVSTFVSAGLIGSPTGLAFDSSGNLYVASYSTNTISEVTPAGVVSSFVSSGLSGPEGLAFDSGGNLYAANALNGTINKVTPGRLVSIFVPSSAGLSNPEGLAFDSSGKL